MNAKAQVTSENESCRIGNAPDGVIGIVPDDVVAPAPDGVVVAALMFAMSPVLHKSE